MKILVSGLLNIETSLKVASFPINYNPIEYPFFGVNSCVSGVGYNIAKALKTLGDDVALLSKLGKDLNGELIINELKANDIDTKHLEISLKQTPQSVVLVDQEGKRKIYCDLKDIQDSNSIDVSNIDLSKYSLLALTNINFNRDLLKAAKEKGVKVATDVHVLSSLEDTYNDDFMKAADILFLSNEAIFGREEQFIKEIYGKYRNEIIICGCGEKGALMYVGKEDKMYQQGAVAPLGITSTIGAGDALFSCFIHYYAKGEELEECLKKATLFAGIKISQNGGSNGFINELELNRYLK